MEALLDKLRNGRRVTIVALGDSITELTFHTRGRLNWCGYLQEALFETYGRNRCWVINSGRCGETVEGALDRLDDDVLRFDPDLVIVSYGMNEAGSDMSCEVFRESMIQLIDLIRRHRDCEVLLRTPNPVVKPPPSTAWADGPQYGGQAADNRVGRFAETIVQIGLEKGCAVVDHYTEWKRRESQRGVLAEEPNRLWLYMSDPVHPGPLGHLAFFREMADLFKVPASFPWEANGIGC